jgi:hypothetical protein
MSLHRPTINRPLRPLISVIAVLLTVMSVALPVLFYNEIVALYQEIRVSNSDVGVVLSQFDRSDVGTNPPSERIAYGETVSGTVTDDDGDQWHFIGSAGDIVTISLENTTSLDPFLELRNNYDLVVQDDDGGDGRNSLIAGYTLPRDDTYLIVARGWNGDTGGYTLLLNATETRHPTNTPLATPFNTRTATLSVIATPIPRPTRHPTTRPESSLSTSTMQSDTTCPGTGPTLFVSGNQAVVDFSGESALRILRDYRGGASDTIAQLYDGNIVELLNGPECFRGVWYWQIYYQRMNAYGWIAEIGGSERYLCPFNDPECG